MKLRMAPFMCLESVAGRSLTCPAWNKGCFNARHSKSHSQEYPSRLWTNKCSMVFHEHYSKKHTIAINTFQQMPYTCQTCGKKFTSFHGLTQHVSNTHNMIASEQLAQSHRQLYPSTELFNSVNMSCIRPPEYHF